MRKGIARGFCLAALSLAVFASATSAQDTVRVRGTIERVEGPIYVIKSRDGTEMKVALAENGLVVALVKASLADIKQGSFVGATGMPQPDGSQKAIEVHIFPEAMRGTGEGHYPWDLRADSTMTTANVEQSATSVDGQTLTLKYKNGEKKVIVHARDRDRHLQPERQERAQAGSKNLHRRRKKTGRRQLADTAHQLRQGRSYPADVKLRHPATAARPPWNRAVRGPRRFAQTRG